MEVKIHPPRFVLVWLKSMRGPQPLDHQLNSYLSFMKKAFYSSLIFKTASSRFVEKAIWRYFPNRFSWRQYFHISDNSRQYSIIWPSVVAGDLLSLYELRLTDTRMLLITLHMRTRGPLGLDSFTDLQMLSVIVA